MSGIKFYLAIALVLCFCAGVAGAQPIRFPLKASTNKRYIADASGRPVFLKGSASWRLTYAVSYEEASRFLKDRKARGFNALILEITPDNGTGNGGNAPDVHGHYCFVDKDIARPNEAFFAHADSILRLCREMNFAVVLFPLYLGCCRDGWLEILQESPNNVQKCYDYGRWVAKRYQWMDNIIWASGGDHNETKESIAFAEGIASVDSTHLHTYHTNPAFTSTERLPEAKWLTLSAIYTYFPDMNVEEYQVYGQIYREKLRNRRMPYFMAESAYENERNENTQTIRRQAYWSLMSGSCGHFFGNRDLWVMNENWPNAIGSDGNRSMQIFHSLVDSLPWFNMEPDWQHLVFFSGRGTFNGGTDPGGEDYATAAMATDGSVAAIYLPSFRKVGVNLARFRGRISIRWFDPSSGRFILIPKTYENNGVKYFEPPSFTNHQGFDDWVLIINASASGR